MQIVTVNLPAIYVDAIAKLTDQGLFPSRSEAIRVALRDFLKGELGMVESLLDLNENEGKVIAAIQAVPSHPTKQIDMRTTSILVTNSLSDAKIAGIKHQLGMR